MDRVEKSDCFCEKSLLALYAVEAYIIGMQTVGRKLKSRRFVARVTEEDRQLFQQAAMLEGRSMATFVITHSREMARQVINQRNQLQLDAAQSRRFVEAMLSPPPARSAAMNKAVARYRTQVTET